jgi:dTDP-4-amino-4,6-dideoxygalactose transaminase
MTAPQETFPMLSIPAMPVFSWAALRGTRRSPVASLLDIQERVLTTSGRSALALALQQLTLDGEAEVLLPAYHCVAMRGPVLYVGAKPRYYRCHADLSIDIDNLLENISKRTRCIVVVHFFGYPQQLSALRSICDQRHISLIEDCAHTMFGDFPEGHIGTMGDFAIGSLMKFFPVFDGGCLVSSRHSLRQTHTRRGPISFQLKSALDILERASQWQRLGMVNCAAKLLLSLRDGMKRAVRSMSAAGVPAVAPNSAEGGLALDPDWVDIDLSFASKCVLHSVGVTRIVELRRAHYRRLLVELEPLREARALFDELPNFVVPYVFPLLLQKPDRDYMRLRNAGLPLYRWEDVAAESCDNAASYSKSLVQLPCHQELSQTDMAAMISAIKSVLN